MLLDSNVELNSTSRAVTVVMPTIHLTAGRVEMLEEIKEVLRNILRLRDNGSRGR